MEIDWILAEVSGWFNINFLLNMSFLGLDKRINITLFYLSPF